jgi:hypothetical protein
VAHLLEGLGDRGISRLFHNLSILAWATVIAKGVELLAPWEENSPLFKFIGECCCARCVACWHQPPTVPGVGHASLLSCHPSLPCTLCR